LGQLGAGFGALAFEALLREKARAAKPLATADLRQAVSVDPLRPFAPRAPHFTPRAKSVIFLFMVGGPSQVDTFDYKPQLQALHGQPLPASLRQAIAATKFSNVTFGCEDKLLGSPYSWAQYGQSGMWVSELFPYMARHVDDLCFIHSMQAESNNHAPASYQLHTGDVRVGKASLGSWTTYGLGSENQDLPGYVVLFDAGPLGGAGNYSNGFCRPRSSRRVCATRGRPCSTYCRRKSSRPGSGRRSI
jgi:hypothetical protein